MMKCYEQFLGKFPFYDDGFALVETPYLGMEHQTAIAYGNGYQTGYAGYDFSRIGLDFDYIIIHETGHEWWGNSVSCKDMADLWIHEGFCTYSESIYVECMHGYEVAMDYVNAKKPTIGNEYPMQGVYDVNNEGDGDMYNKGMLFLNTLRHIVNDDEKWWAGIKHLADVKYKYSTVNADDIITFFNEWHNYDFTKIFEQYIAYPDIPALMYRLEKTGKGQYDLYYKWSTDVEGFSMPVNYYRNDTKETLLVTDKMQIKTISIGGEKEFDWDDRSMYFEKKNYKL